MLGDFARAQELLEEVISIYTEWWGRRHTETTRVTDELAWMLMEECKYKHGKVEDVDAEARRAGELWNEVLDSYRRTTGDASDVVVRIEVNMRQVSCYTTVDAFDSMTLMGSISPAPTYMGWLLRSGLGKGKCVMGNNRI